MKTESEIRHKLFLKEIDLNKMKRSKLNKNKNLNKLRNELIHSLIDEIRILKWTLKD